MQTIIHSVLLIVATGFVGGVILVIGSRLFSVEVDSRLWHVIDMLPGLNCGSCGNPGCAGYASAILAGAPCDLCGPGGEATANAIALYLGRDPGHTTVRKAVVTCNGAADRLRSVEAYEGDPSCRVFDLMGYMTESCTYGCLGLGDCVASCPFDAIRINGNHVAAIDVGRCMACGICVDVCPRHVIAIHERSQTDSPSVVLCCNTMDGQARPGGLCQRLHRLRTLRGGLPRGMHHGHGPRRPDQRRMLHGLWQLHRGVPREGHPSHRPLAPGEGGSRLGPACPAAPLADRKQRKRGRS